MTTTPEALQNHLKLCDEVYQLTLEENRFLKQNQRTPDQSLLTRKRDLLARLEQSVEALRALSATPAEGRPSSDRKETVEKARAKILQILHLDRENEQLLLRYSLSMRPPRPDTPPPAATPPPKSQIQRLYDRHV